MKPAAWIRLLVARRRSSDLWLYTCLALSWGLVTGGIAGMIWGNGLAGFCALAAGLFAAMFEVGLLELARAAWLGMRLASLAGDRAEARAEKARQRGAG